MGSYRSFFAEVRDEGYSQYGTTLEITVVFITSKKKKETDDDDCRCRGKESMLLVAGCGTVANTHLDFFLFFYSFYFLSDFFS